jgi:two-component system CheB/CheR fusion protein
LALLAVVVATGLRLLMDPWMDPDAIPYITFNAAVALTAFFWGWGPGIVATIVGGLACDFFVIPPRYAMPFHSAAERVPMGLFLGTGLLVSLLAGRLHASRRLAEEHARSLRQRAEELQRERSLLATISQATDVMLVYLDRNFDFVSVNEAYARSCKMRPEEMIGKHHFALYPHEENEAIFRQVRDTGVGVFHKDKPFVFSDQPERGVTYWDWSLAPVKEGSGPVAGLVFSQRETTQYKLAEEELGRNREWLRVMLNSIGDAVIASDSGGRVTFLNPVAAALTGWPAEEAVGQPIAGVFRLINEQTHEPAEDLVARVLRERRIVAMANHTALIARDDREIPIEDSAAPITDAAGEVGGVVLVFHEVAEKRRAQEALRESREDLNRGQAVGHIGTWRLNVVSNELLWSEENHRIFGVPRGTPLTYEVFLSIVHPEDREDVDRQWQAALRGEPYDIEHRIVTAEGVRWVCERVELEFDAEGKLLGGFGTTQDITERKRVEDELKCAKLSAERAKAVAEAASKAKDQFIAVLSHELRTPLTPAMAAVSVMAGDPRLPGDVREDLAMVQRNIGLEVRLIADLLDVSRMISGKLHLEKRPVDVAAAIREAATIVSGDLDAKGQTLTIETPGAPYFMPADVARLQQVVWNLLRNAIKFTPARGRIAIRAAVVPVDHCPLAAKPCPVGLGECPLPQASKGNGEPGGGNLIVQVIDNGCGIAPDVLPRLFNAFEQGQEARTFGGLGLGLSICKAVTEMHGGGIAVHSDGPGKGATFTITLRVAQCPLIAAGSALPVTTEQTPTHHAQTPADQESRPIRILLVEDHADTAKFMKRLLMAEGHEVTLAASVAAGLAAVEQSAGKIDLMISDVGLPDGTGHDLMRQLLDRGQAIPGIALSGYGTPADIEISKAVGFAEHLVKPISPDLLSATIQRLTQYHKRVPMRDKT